MRTNVKFPKFSDLKEISGIETIIQLMMIVSDLVFCNESLGKYKESYKSKQNDQDRGAAMYFIRIQMSHLYEALEIIKKINKDNGALKGYLSNCSKAAKNEFNDLMSCRDNGKLDEIKEQLKLIRNKLSFHYQSRAHGNTCLIKKYIERRANSELGNNSKIERSDHKSKKYYKVSDDIIDSILCREILGVKDDVKNIQNKVDDKLMVMNDLCLKLIAFADEYIYIALKV